MAVAEERERAAHTHETDFARADLLGRVGGTWLRLASLLSRLALLLTPAPALHTDSLSFAGQLHCSCMLPCSAMQGLARKNFSL